MPVFKTHKDVENWLATCRPEEAILLAARATLRILPLLARDKRKQMPATLLLPVFRAMAASWVASTWPSPSTETATVARAAAEFAARAARITMNARLARAIRTIALATTKAAAHTTEAAHAINANAPARVASLTAIATRAAADAIVENTQTAYTKPTALSYITAYIPDAEALERGETVLELSVMPLWPKGEIPEEMSILWDNLKSRLPEDEGWDVWTKWYEERLHGIQTNMELEKARALIPNEDWEKGPSHVNEIIKQSMEKGHSIGHAPEFKGNEDPDGWLKNFKFKDEEIILIVARSALRILPALAMDGRKEMPADLLLPVFRTAVAPWVAGTWPDSDVKIARTVANERITDAETAAFAARAANAANATAKAARAATPTPNANVVARAIRAIPLAGLALPKVEDKCSDADAADIAALRERATVQTLSAMPLWADGKTPEAVTKLWDNLKSKLPEGEDWDVWTTWYEARLRGDPADKELEKARVEIPNEDWRQGPAHVNAIIKRLIAEHDGLDFEKFQEIAANAETPRLGSPEELKARGEVEECAEAAEAALLEGSQQHGGMGHNQPPEELQLREDDFAAARESVAAIGTEVRAETPDIVRVAQNASVLKRVVGWVAEKLDMTVNAFCKAFGATLGRVAAVGISAAIVLPPYWGKLATLLEGVWNWLRLVLG